MVDKNTVCGFIGLGSQGAPIARRMIRAGYPMVLWARRAETLNPFRETPARLADSIADLARDADHVGICVVGDDGVTEVCDQLIPAMKSGASIAIHSTILPETCKSLEQKAKACGVALVDAPVSGGQPAADAGKLTVMLGGDPATIERLRPIIDTFAELVVRLGDVGAGQKAKLINNSLMVANMGLAHRAVTAGEEMGLSRDALLELLQGSSGGSFALDIYARYSGPQAFGRAATLIEKIHLLGEVLGKDHPAYRLLWEAANPLTEQSG